MFVYSLPVLFSLATRTEWCWSTAEVSYHLHSLQTTRQGREREKLWLSPPSNRSTTGARGYKQPGRWLAASKSCRCCPWGHVHKSSTQKSAAGLQPYRSCRKQGRWFMWAGLRSVKRKQNFKRILQLFSEINQSARWKDSSLGRRNRFVLHRTLFFYCLSQRLSLSFITFDSIL